MSTHKGTLLIMPTTPTHDTVNACTHRNNVNHARNSILMTLSMPIHTGTMLIMPTTPTHDTVNAYTQRNNVNHAHNSNL